MQGMSMRTIEIPGFDEARDDKMIETEVIISDWFRLHIGEDGAVDLVLRTSGGEKTEINFDDQGSLTSLVRDIE